MAPLKRITVLFTLCFVFIVHAADEPPFPHISDLEIEFYQTEVQVTNIDMQITAFATEYYDGSVPRGKVDVLVAGNRQTVIFNNDTNEILEVNATDCQTWDTDESLYDYSPIFYGWLNKDPLIIGPSAPLWFANQYRDNLKYDPKKVSIRNITCDHWTMDVFSRRDNVTYHFYFADKDWTTPYQMPGLRVPIRIEVTGLTSTDVISEDDCYPINQYTDFAYFKPSISSFRVFQPPMGIGCPLRKATRTMPEFPKIYKYTAEVYDLLKAEKSDDVDVEYQQVWYDSINKLARLDKYSRLKYTLELSDFNTGVTYRNTNGQTCTIEPLRNSFFEGNDGKMIGHLKEPGEVLGLQGTFYYMGKGLIRGIWSDIFESVTLDTVFMQQTLSKLVVTIYFSQSFYEVVVDGEPENRIPVHYIIKGYDADKKVTLNLQYNIFGFDDVIYPEMYSEFQLARCFPSTQDKSYFILIMDVKPEVGAMMEGQDDLVLEQIRSQISNVAKVSNLRIPLLKADYKSSGVYVTGLLLDRPPALKQFFLEYEGEVTTTDPDVKTVIDADTREKCAFACVDETDFTCTGFYFCNQACFIKSKDLLEPDEDGDEKKDFGKCQTWLRAERDSTNKEAYLIDALQTLEDAITNQSIKIEVPLEKDAIKEVIIKDIVIGDGPFTGSGNQEKPYDQVINFAKLRSTDATTQDIDYVDTLLDCYKQCKDSSLDCSSFSYCPDSDNRQCKLSSMVIVSKQSSISAVEDDKNCYVYAMKYMDYYTAYEGHTALVEGDDTFSGIELVEECAKRCRQSTKVDCRGFEYCRKQKSCVLHSKHILDLKPGQVSKKTPCTHYAAKFSADYYDTGLLLIEDDSDSRSELTLDECSRICSEELKGDCKSFNYCPASGPMMTDSTCALSKKVRTDPRVPTTTKPNCHHYEKKKIVDDWGKTDTTTSLVTAGYTSKGFTGLVIGMLALGLVVGAIGFVSYSYFRSRSSTDNMTVKFMRTT